MRNWGYFESKYITRHLPNISGALNLVLLRTLTSFISTRKQRQASCVRDGCIAPGVAFECKIDLSVSALGFGIIFQLIRKISAINVLELPAVGQFFALGA